MRATTTIVLIWLVSSAWAAQDAERATHGDEASSPQVSFEETIGPAWVRQYQLGCLSHLTYLVVSDGEALIVDPQRDVDHYFADAKAKGATIRYVLLTHTNADFVAGHTEVAARSGAKIVVAKNSDARFPHEPVGAGDRIRLGPSVIEVVETPGHTLDSVTYLVRPRGETDTPVWAFTGDALFVGSIGRPDLAEGETAPSTLAKLAYETVQRFAALPDAVRVLPGHGAGSLCGAHLSPETHSTIGAEKRSNPYFALKSRAAFVAKDLSGLAPAPAYFAHNVRINRAGPPVVEKGESPTALAPAAVLEWIQKGAWVIDVRDHDDYAAGHLTGSINIALRGRLDTWLGTVVPFGVPLVLVGSAADVSEAAFRFRRIGIDRVEGWLEGGTRAWVDAGHAVAQTPLLSVQALQARIAAGTEPLLVDVRTAEEFEDARIGDITQLDLVHAERFGRILDPELETVFVCNSAYRSSMAIGLAERQGLKKVSSLRGGLDAWMTEGLAVKGRSVEAPRSEANAKSVPVPEPIAASTLATLMKDRPGEVAVWDLRPASAYQEFHLPGSVSMADKSVAEAAAALPASVRIVLVDRDATVAWAVGGALLAQRPDLALRVRVLTGGLSGLMQMQDHEGRPSPTATPPSPAGVAPAVPAIPTKKRSAGC